MTSLKSIPHHSPSMVTRKTGNEYVLVPITNNIADMDTIFTLNETGAFIWEQIDGEKSVEDLIKAIIKEYDVSKITAEADVMHFIENMNMYLIINDIF